MELIISFYGFHKSAKMQNFRLSSLLALLAALSPLTVQGAAILDSDADVALILARQAPGTPQYDCHSNCGKLVLLSQLPLGPDALFLGLPA